MKYTEIFRLKTMLEEANIPFDFKDRGLIMGYRIIYPDIESWKCSVIQASFSYGGVNNCLEIMGLLTEKEEEVDDVVGHLSAENVFDRIKKDYMEDKNG